MTEGLAEGRTFEALGLSEARLAAVEALGWERPTPIQWQAIPDALEGKDVVGIAQTGTGKTGGFMIPALEGVRAGDGLQVLVLCPTRELAQQVADDTLALAVGTRLRCCAIYGGVGYGPQIEALDQKWEVIVATPRSFSRSHGAGTGRSRPRQVPGPGRGRPNARHGGFVRTSSAVLRLLPSDRQTMLFSATMPNGVHDLALRITKDAFWIEAARSGTTASGITEVVYSVKPEKKPDLLVHLLQHEGWDHVLVFTRTKVGADVLVGRLGREGIRSDVMHSDRQMKHRTKALEDFAAGKVGVLVATDIAQRGLDVEGITHVVNYDVPLDPEDYIHRVGRTARAGASGNAVTFATAGDLGLVRTLEFRLGRDLPRQRLEGFDYVGAPPTEDEGARRKHARSAGGMGSRSAEDLSPEELDKLLGFGS